MTRTNPPQMDDLALLADEQEDVFVLMSLALDGLLDAEELARFDARVAGDPALRETWQQWQKADTLFCSAATLAAVPQAGFVARFDAQLDKRLAQRRARRHMFYGAAAAIAWLSMLALVVVAGWYLFSNQTQWMNGFVRELVYYPSAVSIWVRAVRSSLSATISEPQSIAVMGCYAMASAVLLAIWMWFLRRTTQEEVVS